MLSRIFAVFTALLFALGGISRADTFTYTFVAGCAGQLSFESPDILTADTILSSSDFLTNIAISPPSRSIRRQGSAMAIVVREPRVRV